MAKYKTNASDKEEVKSVYGAIVTQALQDWEEAVREEDRKLKRDVRSFFRSAWGQGILDVLDLDFDAINDKLHIIKTKKKRGK